MSLEEDDVPPLEDMTDYVNRLKMRSDAQHTATSTASTALPSTTRPVKVDSSLLKLEDDSPGVDRPSLIVTESGSSSMERKREEKRVNENSSSKKLGSSTVSGFAGMKKGFLSGTKGGKSNKPKKPTAATSGDSIPLLQGKKETTDNLHLEEVQEQLKKTHPLLATKEWMTDDLLSKIDQNPILSKAFGDPSLFKVLEEFHRNPQEALAAAQQTPEVREFLQQFCSLMGEHFTEMADSQQENDQPPPPLISEQLSEDEQHVRDLLNNPDVKAALLDPDIIKLMETLKSNPAEAQRLLQSIQSNPTIQSKIKTLVDNGLLSVQRT